MKKSGIAIGLIFLVVLLALSMDWTSVYFDELMDLLSSLIWFL